MNVIIVTKSRNKFACVSPFHYRRWRHLFTGQGWFMKVFGTDAANCAITREGFLLSCAYFLPTQGLDDVAWTSDVSQCTLQKDWLQIISHFFFIFGFLLLQYWGLYFEIRRVTRSTWEAGFSLDLVVRMWGTHSFRLKLADFPQFGVINRCSTRQSFLNFVVLMMAKKMDLALTNSLMAPN